MEPSISGHYPMVSVHQLEKYKCCGWARCRALGKPAFLAGAPPSHLVHTARGRSARFVGETLSMWAQRLPHRLCQLLYRGQQLQSTCMPGGSPSPSASNFTCSGQNGLHRLVRRQRRAVASISARRSVPIGASGGSTRPLSSLLHPRSQFSVARLRPRAATSGWGRSPARHGSVSPPQLMDWLIEPPHGGDRDRVRQLAQLVRQQETPGMLRIAADLHRRGGDTAEADALLARAEKMEAK